MRYLATTLLVLLALVGLDAACFLALAPAPIRAEYWAGEVLTVKRAILARQSGRRKVIVVSGSSSLFDVDTTAMTRELGLPVVNLGLHMGLPLDEILAAGEAGAQPGDVVVLALEPRYYCDRGLTGWQIRNAVAWDRGRWNALSARDKLAAAAHAGPLMPFEILLARTQQAFGSGRIAARLRTMDEAQVLARFDAAPTPVSFAYAADHLDALGNLQATASDVPYHGPVADANLPVPVCAASVHALTGFVARLRSHGVRVFFAGTPSVLTAHVDRAAVARAAARFAADVSPIAPLLDSRASLLFEPRFFLNSDLHLNAAGRALRTTMLLEALRKAGALDIHDGAVYP